MEQLVHVGLILIRSMNPVHTSMKDGKLMILCIRIIHLLFAAYKGNNKITKHLPDP